MGRIEKVNQMLKREISQLINTDLGDPRLKFVTITHVKTSSDLRYARVGFSVLGDEKQIQSAMDGLNSAKGLLRKMVSKEISMRYMPEFSFEVDRSIEYSARIEKALQDIHDEQHDKENDS